MKKTKNNVMTIAQLDEAIERVLKLQEELNKTKHDLLAHANKIGKKDTKTFMEMISRRDALLYS